MASSAFRDNIMISLTRGRFRNALAADRRELRKKTGSASEGCARSWDGWRKAKDECAVASWIM